MEKGIFLILFYICRDYFLSVFYVFILYCDIDGELVRIFDLMFLRNMCLYNMLK